MAFAPIALFTYNRLWHTQQTVSSLRSNASAADSELFVFSDGPRDQADQERVHAVRTYCRNIGDFKKITVIERENNLGLAHSVIAGVTEIVNKYGRVIVLEDDMITSPYFLQFMNEALEFYKNEEKVISIHGYMYPVKVELQETFFLKGADCWGWATWKRGWDLFDADGHKLLIELKTRNLTHAFDFDGSYDYTKMLEDQASGKNDSWAIRWYASAFLKDRFTLYPGKSLIHNTGIDKSGIHCGTSNIYDTEIMLKPIKIKNIPIEENIIARDSIKDYFLCSNPSLARRALNSINRILHK